MLADPNNVNRQDYEILLDAAKNWKIYNYKEFIDDYIRTDRIKFNNNALKNCSSLHIYKSINVKI